MTLRTTLHADAFNSYVTAFSTDAGCLYEFYPHTAFVIAERGDAAEAMPLDRFRRYLAYIEAPEVLGQDCDIRDLVMWASKRSRVEVFSHGCDDCAIPVTRTADYQRILGAPFDRELVRDVLQAFIETHDGDVSARIALCACPSPNEKHRCLKITTRTVRAVVMQVASEVECGGDDWDPERHALNIPHERSLSHD